MESFGVVEVEVFLHSFIEHHPIVSRAEIDVLVCETAREAFDKDGINCSSFSIHADANPFSVSSEVHTSLVN